MARLLQIPKEEHLEYLRMLICNKYGKPVVNSLDCGNLELQILKFQNKRLSVDTLLRLFNIKKGKTLPSIYTLDTCSSFVGYKNWNDLIINYQKQSLLYQKNIIFELINKDAISFEHLLEQFEAMTISNETYELFNQVILIKSQQKDIIFFKNIFKFSNLFKFREIHKFNIYHTIHLLGILCEKNEWLSNIAVNQYYNLPYEEDYFVEWLVIPEQDYYLNLIENYYQSNKKNIEKVVFYHLIICTKAHIIYDYDLFDKHYKELVYLSLESKEIHHLLQMRWLGVQLLHHYKMNDLEKINLICRTIFKSNAVKSKDAGNRISCIFMISQYLHKVKEYENIIKLFEEKSIKYSNILGYWADLNYNQLKVYYTNALLKTNQKEKAINYFKDIKTNRFDLNFKNEIEKVYNELSINLEY